MKAKDLFSVGGCSLRKQDDAHSITQALGDAGASARAIALLLPPDKDRARLGSESSNDWPTSDLGLRDEYTRQGGAEGENVEIAEMIGNYKSAGGSISV